MSADEELLGDVKKLKDKTKNKRTKAEAVKDNLKSNIVTTNVELIEAYSDWIDAVFSKEGWMSKKAVMLGQSTVDEFSGRDLDIALNLLNIAALHGHRDINWSIAKYKEQCKVKKEYQPQITNPQKMGLSSEVF
jgi:hypothetical protein